MEVRLAFDEFGIFHFLAKDSEFLDTISKLRTHFQFRKKVQIYGFHSIHEVSARIGFKVPHWVGALAFDDTILIKKFENGRSCNGILTQQVVIHEFVHIVVNHVTKNKCPLWINEGIAQYYSGEYEHIALKKSMPADFDIYDLTEYSPLLYSMSASFVSKLICKYGEERVISDIRNANFFSESSIFNPKNIKNDAYEF